MDDDNNEYDDYTIDRNREMDWETAQTMPMWGQVSTKGWDIPTTWAIDKQNQCWIGNGHGDTLSPTSTEHLLNFLNGNGYYSAEAAARRLLGLKQRVPGWVSEALKNGWTPPPDFDRNAYEWPT